MEAAPSSSLVVAEPELLLQLLVVPLDPPAQLGEATSPRRRLLRQGGQPVLGRLLLRLRATRSAATPPARRRADHRDARDGPAAGKARGELPAAPSRQVTVCQASAGRTRQAPRPRSADARPRAAAARRPATARPRPGGSGPCPGARATYATGCRRHRPGPAPRSCTKVGVVAVARVGQHDACRNAAALARGSAPARSRAWSGTELLRHTSHGRRSGSSAQPGAGRVGRRPAGWPALATERVTATWQLSCLPTGRNIAAHADREPALLRKAGVVDDPGLDRSVPSSAGSAQLAHPGQHPLIRPGRLATKWCSDWCSAEVRAGSMPAAIGSTLLRSKGAVSPTQ